MANKIFLQYMDTNQQETTSIFPLTEDPTLEVGSEFKSFSDDIPQISSILALMQNLGTTGGEASQGITNLLTALDAPRWQKTNPVRITTKLLFYTEENPYDDVYKPMTDIMSLSILTVKGEGENARIAIPGISLRNFSDFQLIGTQTESDVKKRFSEYSKIISIEIPGVIYLEKAIVEKAVPTYSKETTDSGFPLWGSLDMTMVSLAPAHTGMFQATARRQTDAFVNQIVGG